MTNDEKLLKLRKELKDAQQGMLKERDRKKILDWMDKVDVAEKALKDFEDSLITPEQKDAQDRYQKALEQFEKVKAELEEQSKKLAEVYPNSPSLGRKYQKSGEERKVYHELTVEDAEKIRKANKEGMSSKDIMAGKLLGFEVHHGQYYRILSGKILTKAA